MNPRPGAVPRDVPLWQVDAFTDRAFSGNPAAVCLLDAPADERWMQAVAAEMNLSETAFAIPVSTQPSTYGLRWFTPSIEVDLCGHATLATAHVLCGREADAGNVLTFNTRSGILRCERKEDWYVLDFPATAIVAEDDVSEIERLEISLGCKTQFVGRTRFDRFVVVESGAELRDLRPDFLRLSQIETRGVIATAKSDTPGVDFLSRFFAPRAGIDEDPVTGSAHCALALHWSRELQRKTLVGYQASERGGTVRTEHRGERVLLSGQAVTVMSGMLVATER